MSFKFNYIPYIYIYFCRQLYTILNKKVIVWINKIYLCVRTNLIIYVTVTNF